MTWALPLEERLSRAVLIDGYESVVPDTYPSRGGT
jgi:hypothetical protein